jgi:hypothetical protein
LFYPAYVVEYAANDSAVTLFDGKTLNIGGEWLGEVPQLAICRNAETSEFHLSRCSNEWECFCAVQTASSVQEIKDVAEKHYKGINANWIKTDYKKEEALALFEKE